MENLWTVRGSAVHDLSRHNSFCAGFERITRFARSWCSLRTLFRLYDVGKSLESSAHQPVSEALKPAVNRVVFNETIKGRPYVIEVQSVGRDRWRAGLARSGRTTALMPYYGTTPDESAQQLAIWLSRANGTPAKSEVRSQK